MRKHKMMLLVLIFLLFALSGCGKVQKEQETSETGAFNVVDVKKDGSVVNTIEEPFEQEYYNEERLKDLILSEVVDYNQEAGESRVEVKKLSVKKNVVKLMAIVEYIYGLKDKEYITIQRPYFMLCRNTISYPLSEERNIATMVNTCIVIQTC